MKKRILTVILVAAICVFIFSVYMIVSTQLKYKKGTDTYNDLTAKAVSLSSSFSLPSLDHIGKETTETNEIGLPVIELDNGDATSPIVVDEKELEVYNPDIIGWLYCPDTNINYPVLQADDNDYYLRKMANKEYNIAGSIFMDYRNTGEFSDLNTIIYGHNMKNGTMFSDIMKYKNEGYYDSHQYLYYTTEEKSYVFKVIGAKVVEPNDRIYSSFYDVSEIREYLKSCTSNILFDKDIDIDMIDRLVTLSTCSNDAGTQRYVLYCIPIEITAAS